MRLVFILLVFAVPKLLWAAELRGVSAGVLPFAMGGAYSAVADDWHSLHHNPAGLAQVKGVDFQIVGMTLGVNKDSFESYSEFSDLGSDGTLADKLAVLSNKHVHIKAQDISQITVPHFAGAFIIDNTADFDFKNTANPNITIRYVRDLGFKVGMGFGIGKKVKSTKQNMLRAGFAVSLITRTGGTQNIAISQIGGQTTALLDTFENEGTGVGFDAGLQWQWPLRGRLEVVNSLVVHNFGRTRFGTRDQADRPDPEEENLVVGLGVRLPIGGKVNRRKRRRMGGHPRSSSSLTFAADYTYLNISPDKEHIVKHMHWGFNLDLPIISLQGGLNQGNITGGLGVNLGLVQVNAATYAEELGSFPGQQKDRRYIFSLAFGFSVGEI